MSRSLARCLVLVFFLSSGNANASIWQTIGEIYVGIMSGVTNLIVDTVLVVAPTYVAIGKGVIDLITPDKAVDEDDDGVDDENDNCLGVYNPSQQDLDEDGKGDHCDADIDGDGHSNESDEFPDDGSEWRDLDGDGIGDNGDPDRDGDSIPNSSDPYPDVPSWLDIDGDGIRNESDSDMDGDGISNSSDFDIDGDGINNDDDAFPSDHRVWSDIDGDGLGDELDADADADGVENSSDERPMDIVVTNCPV